MELVNKQTSEHPMVLEAKKLAEQGKRAAEEESGKTAELLKASSAELASAHAEIGYISLHLVTSRTLSLLFWLAA